MSHTATEHSKLANQFVANEERAHWHDGALWFVRQKRDRQASSLPEWEVLRSLASQIKTHTLANLPRYLEQFEMQAQKLGAIVHWASDAKEHNEIVHQILASNGVTKIVKSKSMLTEECHLNPYLEKQGIEVVDTDLGEWIVQLRNEPPSHIVLPAIHIKKEEVGETFHQHIGTPKGNSDPRFLQVLLATNFGKNLYPRKPALPESTLLLRKRVGLSFARMRVTPTWVSRFHRFISLAWESKSSFLARKTFQCLRDC